MKSKIAILGAGGHGKVVADTALQVGWDEVFFFDDNWPVLKANGDWPVVGDSEALIKKVDEFSGVVVAIGNNRVRLEKVWQFLRLGFSLPVLVHPRSYVASGVKIESGSVVFAGAVIQPGSSLGFAAIVNTGATVDHDCSLSSGVHVCPGAHLAGGVRAGECSSVGIGATVNQYLTLGAYVTIGAGAAVISDVREAEVVVGVPSRLI
jgi:sugar O-acyltransferase (sialic acid O-acetyltransferase NeuD family)